MKKLYKKLYIIEKHELKLLDIRTKKIILKIFIDKNNNR